MARQNPLRSENLKFHIGGGFPETIFKTLKKRPQAVRELGRQVLEAHFPESLHESILGAVGLPMDSPARGVHRDPRFRAEIISAWGHQCLFCGYSVQLDRSDWALQRSHHVVPRRRARDVERVAAFTIRPSIGAG